MFSPYVVLRPVKEKSHENLWDRRCTVVSTKSQKRRKNAQELLKMVWRKISELWWFSIRISNQTQKSPIQSRDNPARRNLKVYQKTNHHQRVLHSRARLQIQILRQNLTHLTDSITSIRPILTILWQFQYFMRNCAITCSAHRTVCPNLN